MLRSLLEGLVAGRVGGQQVVHRWHVFALVIVAADLDHKRLHMARNHNSELSQASSDSTMQMQIKFSIVKK